MAKIEYLAVPRDELQEIHDVLLECLGEMAETITNKLENNITAALEMTETRLAQHSS